MAVLEVDVPLFREAIAKAEHEIGVHIDQSLAEILLEKVNDLKDGYAFKEALNYGLNECRVFDPMKRKACKIFAGKYFGTHGSQVLQRIRQRAAKRTTQKQKVAPKKETKKKEEPKLEGNQYTFEV